MMLSSSYVLAITCSVKQTQKAKGKKINQVLRKKNNQVTFCLDNHEDMLLSADVFT